MSDEEFMDQVKKFLEELLTLNAQNKVHSVLVMYSVVKDPDNPHEGEPEFKGMENVCPMDMALFQASVVKWLYDNRTEMPVFMMPMDEDEAMDELKKLPKEKVN